MELFERLFESLVLNFNPLPQDVFIRNESEQADELHEGVKKAAHHRELNQTP